MQCKITKLYKSKNKNTNVKGSFSNKHFVKFSKINRKYMFVNVHKNKIFWKFIFKKLSHFFSSSQITILRSYQKKHKKHEINAKIKHDT